MNLNNTHKRESLEWLPQKLIFNFVCTERFLLKYIAYRYRLVFKNLKV